LSEGALTREQLEERLATLHRASLELVKNSSLQTLLERIAFLACEQVLAQYAAVGVLDDDGKLENFIPIGISPEAVAMMAHPPVGHGLIGALMNSTEPIRLANIAGDPRSYGFPKHHPAMSSFLGVPIRLGEKQLGQIYLTNKLSAAEFTADDERVIEMLASYAAVAISNARFYQQITDRDRVLTRRTENLALVNELASSLASSEDIEQVLDKVLSQVLDYLRLDVGEVFLRQEDRRMMMMTLHRGESAGKLFHKNGYAFGDGMVGRTAQSEQLEQVDLREVREQPERSKGFSFSEETLRGSLDQMICLPLAGRRGVLGVLAIAWTGSDPLDDLEMQFLSAISAWVGMAIENLRLNVQQRRLAILEERERIGMDLHDGIIQDIYAVGLTLEHARLLMSENPQSARQRIEQAVNDLNSTIRDIRAYILDLRPRKLHEENLVEGLHRLISEFRANTFVDVTFQTPSGEVLLPQAQAVALFHICQEALANVGKHSRARHVDIALWTASDRALLEISDDGRGFDLSTTRLSLGHGLSNMETRANNAGGELEITSETGQGTTILVWVPYTDEV
jgi:signal transduction histidine kinase